MITEIKFQISTSSMKKALKDMKKIENEQKNHPYNNVHTRVVVRVADKNSIIRGLFQKK